MDAGTRATDHYARALPHWRFWLRAQFLELVRDETAVLAHIQRRVRSPLLDQYFALSANIGTHTFYMIMLPVFFWYGDFRMGIQVVLVLALGVFTTGCIKDLLCLPRPRSPPLHRISMSASAKLEYGMPSTHSCNAVSVALVFHQFDPQSRLVAGTSIWLLATLVAGRVYTGMHGFLDIAVGCTFGVLSYWLSLLVLRVFDYSSVADNAALTLLFVIGISLSPNPADDCPCFDDSVAFIGVVLGMMWTLAFTPSPVPFAAKFVHASLGPGALAARALARFVVGVLFVVVWRDVSKRVLLRVLPPVWRVLDRLGLRNPRRFFLPSPAKLLPPAAVADQILDGSPCDFVHTLQGPPHDSVGPQSAADLYEARQAEARQAEAREAGAPTATAPTATAGIEQPRKHYDFAVFMRLIVYGGIGPMALYCAKTAFSYLDV